MRAQLLVIALSLFLLVSSNLRADVNDVNSEEQTGAADIKFGKTVCDFGNIGPGSKQMCEFNFTNVGTGTLKITDVTKTCGCTPFTLEKKEYAPGESGVIKVEYQPTKHPGKVHKTLFVTSNDPEEGKIELSIEANIVLKVQYEPESMNLMLTDDANYPDIVITAVDGKPFSIKNFKSTVNGITADFDPNEKAVKFVLKPKANIEKLGKGVNGRIEIKLTHPEVDEITIPFTTLSRFKLSPPSIILFKSEPNKPVTREIWVLNNYNEDFEVDSVKSSKGFIEVVDQEKNGNRYKFNVKITPPEEKGRMFSDDFLINIKDSEQLKITCRGFYAKEK
ncbi:MAG: DUF1573 domain-containing protein [Phycisphaerae bacterium]|nr:DUF1573 domain-containing protein [Phycisphaerae bacterium]